MMNTATCRPIVVSVVACCDGLTGLLREWVGVPARQPPGPRHMPGYIWKRHSALLTCAGQLHSAHPEPLP